MRMGALVLYLGKSDSWGAAQKADFRFVDLRMSREHFLLIGNHDSWIVRDLDSHHGTWVNDLQVQETIVQEGDLIVAGDTIFRVSLTDGPLRRRQDASASQTKQQPQVANRKTWRKGRKLR